MLQRMLEIMTVRGRLTKYADQVLLCLNAESKCVPFIFEDSLGDIADDIVKFRKLCQSRWWDSEKDFQDEFRYVWQDTVH